MSGTAGRAQTPRWYFDGGGTALAEAWDFNGSSETLAGVVLGADRRVWKGLAVRAEGHVTYIKQRGPDAWLRGVTLGTRGRWYRRHGRPFFDLAFGVSNATAETPPGGTAPNYLIVAGGGIEIPAGVISLELAGRWFHVSNNGIHGARHNPDIQSIGVVVAIGFSR